MSRGYWKNLKLMVCWNPNKSQKTKKHFSKQNLVFRLLDAQVIIEISDQNLRELFTALINAFPSLPKRTSKCFYYKIEKEADSYSIQVNGFSLPFQVEGTKVWPLIRRHLLLSLIYREKLKLLHAAALLYREKVLLLPAPSQSGKTTLTVLLLKQGFRYCSDECVLINLKKLKVIPCFFPLHIRQDMLQNLEIQEELIRLFPEPSKEGQIFYGIVSPESLAPEATLPLGSIIFPQWSSDGQTKLEFLKPGHAAFKFISQLFLSKPLRQADLSEVVEVVKRIPCYSLSVGDVKIAASLIRDLFAS